ncbi:uncharacterized protein LOC141595748 [Silene latifolia]|uniref:uncharacterized protein LOC141595748 n=1 Tax=Silene latifolia TaxID=37657 RepID=UPI003D786AC5
MEEEEERGKFMVGCWAIWEARNKWVFEGKRVIALDVIRRVEELMKEMKAIEEAGVVCTKAANGKGMREGRRESGVWGEGWVRLTCDAGVKEGWGTGLGVICCIDEGAVVWALVERRRGVEEVGEAEAEAVLEGIKEAVRRGQRRLVVESDSTTVIDILQSNRMGMSYLFSIIDEIRALSSSLDDIIWSFVRRHYSRSAHDLAHFNGFNSGRRVWEGCLPDNLISLVFSDYNNMR